MNWQIFVTSPARRQLNKIDSQDTEKVESAIGAMAIDPFIGDIQKMSGKNMFGAGGLVPTGFFINQILGSGLFIF